MDIDFGQCQRTSSPKYKKEILCLTFQSLTSRTCWVFATASRTRRGRWCGACWSRSAPLRRQGASPPTCASCWSTPSARPSSTNRTTATQSSPSSPNTWTRCVRVYMHVTGACVCVRVCEVRACLYTSNGCVVQWNGVYLSTSFGHNLHDILWIPAWLKLIVLL